MYRKFIFIVLVFFWSVTAILDIAYSQIDNTDSLLTDFGKDVSSYKQILEKLASEVATHKQWFKNYQSQLLSEGNGELEDLLNKQLNEVWQEIERLEPLTTTGWLDVLSSQDTTT